MPLQSLDPILSRRRGLAADMDELFVWSHECKGEVSPYTWCHHEATRFAGSGKACRFCGCELEESSHMGPFIFGESIRCTFCGWSMEDLHDEGHGHQSTRCVLYRPSNKTSRPQVAAVPTKDGSTLLVVGSGECTESKSEARWSILLKRPGKSQEVALRALSGLRRIT